MERVERRTLVIAGAIVTALAGLAFGLSSSSAEIVAFGVTFTVVSDIFSNAFHAYGAEPFPTDVRGTAVGTCHSMSRPSTVLLPYVLLPVLTDHGATAVFMVASVAMAVCALDVGLFGPRTTGSALESLEPEPHTASVRHAHSEPAAAPVEEQTE